VSNSTAIRSLGTNKFHAWQTWRNFSQNSPRNLKSLVFTLSSKMKIAQVMWVNIQAYKHTKRFIRYRSSGMLSWVVWQPRTLRTIVVPFIFRARQFKNSNYWTASNCRTRLYSSLTDGHTVAPQMNLQQYSCENLKSHKQNYVKNCALWAMKPSVVVNLRTFRETCPLHRQECQTSALLSISSSPSSATPLSQISKWFCRIARKIIKQF
jgi:hypothetical protein